MRKNLCLLILLGVVVGFTRGKVFRLPPRTVDFPQRGSLVLVGGGFPSQQIKDRFLALAGGPAAKLVYIPTASDDNELPPAAIKTYMLFGRVPATILHTRKRREANSSEFIKPLENATGVWISGGRQWRLLESYQDTATHRALNAVLERGGVIGGNSAGASIQSSYVFRNATLSQRFWRDLGYPLGFGFLPNVAVDVHVAERNRDEDLPNVIAQNPNLIGIGLDEKTALIIQREIAEVMGDGKVTFTRARLTQGTETITLTGGTHYDLRKRERISYLPSAGD
jgi:cyanophycinase